VGMLFLAVSFHIILLDNLCILKDVKYVIQNKKGLDRKHRAIKLLFLLFFGWLSL